MGLINRDHHSTHFFASKSLIIVKIIEITNKVQTSNRIYYSNVLLITQHVSSDTPFIIRSSKNVIAASGFTYVCGCRQLPATTNVCKTRNCNLGSALITYVACFLKTGYLAHTGEI
jgi:hypothetical protein